jgi:hypothetical protein
MKVFLYSAKQSSSRCTWLLEMNSRLSLVAVLRKDVREVLDVLKTGRLSKSVVVPEHGAFAAAAVAAAVVVVFAVA